MGKEACGLRRVLLPNVPIRGGIRNRVERVERGQGWHIDGYSSSKKELSRGQRSFLLQKEVIKWRGSTTCLVLVAVLPDDLDCRVFGVE